MSATLKPGDRVHVSGRNAACRGTVESVDGGTAHVRLDGYMDRWCYQGPGAAIAAAEKWDGTGEPEGWHRHPASGRRRPDGDPEREYVAP